MWVHQPKCFHRVLLLSINKCFRCFGEKEADLPAVAAAYYDYYNSMEGDNRSATISVIQTFGLEMLKVQLRAAESRVERWEWIDLVDCRLFYCLSDGRHLLHTVRFGLYKKRIGSVEESAAFDEGSGASYHL